MEKKLVPYSIYIPRDLYVKIKKLAKARQASSMIRDAIKMLIEGNDAYKAGYRKGIEDAAKVVYDCPEAQMVAVKGKDIGALLKDRIEALR